MSTMEDIQKRDKKFIEFVLNFYYKQGRHSLVWRKYITPYRILVSEMMLQQTQVTRVLQKFDEWIKRYPTLTSLRGATLQDILILWKGLGYQRRAKALYEIAQSYKRLPTSFTSLCELPGIGPYTASALCAFAYDEFSHPMLETNIRTALIEEYHQGEVDIQDGLLYDDLKRLSASSLVKKAGARVWYYALMDYGVYLKENKISHNAKSAHYTKQSPYKGSLRELRAKVLFAITEGNKIPGESRTEEVLGTLVKEGYITKKGEKYSVI